MEALGFVSHAEVEREERRLATRKLKKRQREIIAALQVLGGRATTRQIAEKAGFHVNGVAQALGALFWLVAEMGDRRGGEREWHYRDPNLSDSRRLF